MNDSTSPKKKSPRGCLVAFVALLGLIALVLILTALTPYFREERPILVTVLDEAQQPVPDATIDFQEYEWVFFIPPLTFASPSHLIDRQRSVTTDAHGKAQFTVKLQNADAHRISRGGQVFKVIYCQTSNTFSGAGQRFSGGSLPQWVAIGGVAKVSYESTIVVSTQQSE